MLTGRAMREGDVVVGNFVPEMDLWLAEEDASGD